MELHHPVGWRAPYPKFLMQSHCFFRKFDINAPSLWRADTEHQVWKRLTGSIFLHSQTAQTQRSELCKILENICTVDIYSCHILHASFAWPDLTWPDLTWPHSFTLCLVLHSFAQNFSMDGFSVLFHWLPFVVGNQDSSKIKCILNRGSDDARCTMQVAPPCQPAVTQTWVGRLNWSSVEFDFGSWGRPQVFVTAPTKPLVRLTSCMWKQPFHGFCVSQFSDGKYVHRLGSYKLVLRVENSTQEHTWEEISDVEKFQNQHQNVNFDRYIVNSWLRKMSPQILSVKKNDKYEVCLRAFPE